LEVTVSGGAPQYFSSPDELQEQIDLYFEDRKDLGRPPTIEGLAVFLGFSSRQSIYDYGLRPEFSYIIERAKTRIFTELMEMGLLGDYNASLVKLIATSHQGYTDSNKQDLNAKVSLIEGISIKVIEGDESSNQPD
jgi:hypothetical protein